MHPIADPVERIVADALAGAGIAFVHAGEDAKGLPLTQGFDFYVPGWDIFIECKRAPTERSARQLERAPDIILIQGIHAARAFAAMLL